jgi:hypothetical protein
MLTLLLPQDKVARLATLREPQILDPPPKSALITSHEPPPRMELRTTDLHGIHDDAGQLRGFSEVTARPHRAHAGEG